MSVGFASFCFRDHALHFHFHGTSIALACDPRALEFCWNWRVIDFDYFALCFGKPMSKRWWARWAWGWTVVGSLISLGASVAEAGEERVVSRIAFGSCANQSAPQVRWFFPSLPLFLACSSVSVGWADFVRCSFYRIHHF